MPVPCPRSLRHPSLTASRAASRAAPPLPRPFHPRPRQLYPRLRAPVPPHPPRLLPLRRPVRLDRRPHPRPPLQADPAHHPAGKPVFAPAFARTCICPWSRAVAPAIRSGRPWLSLFAFLSPAPATARAPLRPPSIQSITHPCFLYLPTVHLARPSAPSLPLSTPVSLPVLLFCALPAALSIARRPPPVSTTAP